MKKTEAEKAIRPLSHQWKRETNQPTTPNYHYSFSDFRDWLEQKGYSDYLEFRSARDPLEDAEQWFDEEMGQLWRR